MRIIDAERLRNKLYKLIKDEINSDGTMDASKIKGLLDAVNQVNLAKTVASAYDRNRTKTNELTIKRLENEIRILRNQNCDIRDQLCVYKNAHKQLSDELRVYKTYVSGKFGSAPSGEAADDREG